MITLKEQIEKDFSDAITDRDRERLDLIKVIKAEISREKTKNPTDEEILKIIRRLKEGALICGNTHEVKFFNSYLPVMMTKDEIEINVRTVINANNYNKPSDLGKVMKILNSYGPTLDKKIASEIAKQILLSI